MSDFVQPPSSLDRASFITCFGSVYAHNPWVAAEVFDTGAVPDTVSGLADALRAVVDAAPVSAHLVLLQTQTEAAVTVDEGGEAARLALQRLGGAYRARFGFPFVIAAEGLTIETLAERVAERLGNAPEAERGVALAALHRIARQRLEALAAG